MYTRLGDPKWAMDRKLRQTQADVSALRSHQEGLKAQLAQVTNSQQAAKISQLLSRSDAKLHQAQGRRRALVSDVAIDDSGATSSFGGLEDMTPIFGLVVVLIAAALLYK